MSESKKNLSASEVIGEIDVDAIIEKIRNMSKEEFLQLQKEAQAWPDLGDIVLDLGCDGDEPSNSSANKGD